MSAAFYSSVVTWLTILSNSCLASELLLVNDTDQAVSFNIWVGRDEFNGDNVHNETVGPVSRVLVNPDSSGNAGSGAFCDKPLYIFASPPDDWQKKLVIKKLRIHCGNGRDIVVVR